MKLSNQAFTLVELMIVIAIIGILAAALFPSLTSYLARGRDTSRVSGIRDISVALANYMTDNSDFPVPAGFPTSAAAACISSTELGSKYLPKFPVDPIATRTDNCNSAGKYGYGLQTIGSTKGFLLSAFMENPSGGNANVTSAVLQSTYQGVPTTASMTGVDSLTKGAGAGYVIRQ